MSVNTLFLEELCINEDATVSPEGIDETITRGADYELAAVDAEMSNFKNTVASEEDDASVGSQPSGERAASADNDAETKETRRGAETRQQSQESVKTQPSCRTKESPLKHSAAKNAQDEIEAKRMRLQRQDSKGSANKTTTPQPSAAVKEVDSKSPPLSAPRIKKIESVCYNITPLMPIPKPSASTIQHRSATTASSRMFSPMHYEYCDSNMSSFDQDFAKGDPN